MKWSTVPIGDLVTIRGGGTPQRSNEAYFKGDIPWVTPKDMKRWEIEDAQLKITREAIELSAANEIPENTVLLVVRSGVLKHTAPVAINRRRIAINQDMKSLQCNGRLLPEYLARFLKDAEPTILSWVRATTADNYSIDKVRELRIPLPPLDEQRRIAAILDQADDLRRKRREALERIDQLSTAVFYEMFGNPISNSMAWPEQQFADVCSRVTVGIVVRPASYYQEQGVPAIRGLNIKPTGIDLSDCVFISEASNERLSSSRVWHNDIVIVRSGRPGLAAIIPKELDGINSIDIIIATPKKDRIRSRFLRDFINSPSGRRIVLSESRGQVQQHFNVGALSKARIFVPPLALQDEYDNQLNEIERQAAKLKLACDKTDALFASLQHRAFRGEL